MLDEYPGIYRDKIGNEAVVIRNDGQELSMMLRVLSSLAVTSWAWSRWTRTNARTCFVYLQPLLQRVRRPMRLHD